MLLLWFDLFAFDVSCRKPLVFKQSEKTRMRPLDLGQRCLSNIAMMLVGNDFLAGGPRVRRIELHSIGCWNVICLPTSTRTAENATKKLTTKAHGSSYFSCRAKRQLPLLYLENFDCWLDHVVANRWLNRYLGNRRYILNILNIHIGIRKYCNRVNWMWLWQPVGGKPTAKQTNWLSSEGVKCKADPYCWHRRRPTGQMAHACNFLPTACAIIPTCFDMAC